MKEIVFSKEEIVSFQTHIFSWWETHKRDLPWRNTRDPYKILVSEMMLQQTQVSRVLPKYEEFLCCFPTVFALANASAGDVLRVWRGMGYNRRALYLKKTTEIIVQEYNGIFPREEQILRRFPGLGIYTTRAILVFAFEQDLAFVDTNIRQIIEQFFFHGVSQKESVIQSVADQLLPKGKAWEWHQALMDYGAIVSAKEKAKKREKSVKTSAIPFRESRRFFRGRVIEYLRYRSWSETGLIREMMVKYGKNEVFHRSIVDDLISEGLIECRDNGIISLPE